MLGTQSPPTAALTVLHEMCPESSLNRTVIAQWYLVVLCPRAHLGVWTVELDAYHQSRSSTSTYFRHFISFYAFDWMKTIIFLSRGPVNWGDDPPLLPHLSRRPGAPGCLWAPALQRAAPSPHGSKQHPSSVNGSAAVCRREAFGMEWGSWISGQLESAMIGRLD